MAVPELPEEDWDQELVFPTCPIDWEQAVSQAAAMGENEADMVGDDQVETQCDENTVGAMAGTDVRVDNQVEASRGEADVIIESEEVKTLGEGATAGALAETDAVTDDWIEVQAEEADVIVEEVQEFKVPNEETTEVTDVAQDLENTSPKVIDEDLEVAQALVAAAMPDDRDVLDFEGMPDLEDGSSKEFMGEEPQMDTPPAAGPQPCLGSTSRPRYVRMRSSTG